MTTDYDAGNIYRIGDYRWRWSCAIYLWAACIWHNKRYSCPSLEWEVLCWKPTGVLDCFSNKSFISNFCTYSIFLSLFILNSFWAGTSWLFFQIQGSCQFSDFAMKCIGWIMFQLYLFSFIFVTQKLNSFFKILILIQPRHSSFLLTA